MTPVAASAALEGQVALVTGAAGAMGRRFAQTLAASGAVVALADIRAESLADAAAELEAIGGKFLPVHLDLTRVTEIAGVVDQVEEARGPVTILVNNAGINDAMRPHRMPLDLIEKVITTNLHGPFVLTCEVARRLIAAQLPGRIVNISSMSAFSYHSGTVASLYSVTKAAVARMTETLATEWARYDINVNAIAPGLVWSEMTEAMIDRTGDPSQSLPRKRLVHPAQLDSTLRYLVDPSSECVTGTVVKVDDGQKPR